MSDDRLLWMRDAACREHPAEWWFDTKGLGGTKARQVCRDCLVRVECLTYAIDNGERIGIWGGFCDPHKRRRPCASCHQMLPTAEVAAVLVDARYSRHRRWVCRRCRYQEIQSRKRA